MELAEVLQRSLELKETLACNKIAELLAKFAGILAGFTFYSILTLIKEEKERYKKLNSTPIKILFVVFLSLILSCYLYIEASADNTVRIHFLILCVNLILSISIILMLVSIIWLLSIYNINHGIVALSKKMAHWVAGLIYIYMVFVIYDMVFIMEGSQLLSIYTIIWNLPPLLFLIVYIYSFQMILKIDKEKIIDTMIKGFMLMNIVIALFFAYIKIGKEKEIVDMYFSSIKYISTIMLSLFLFSCKLILPENK
jgi:hypothetical protein